MNPNPLFINNIFQRQELAEIAANEYYITHGSQLERNILLSLLPSYLPDNHGALEEWADLVEESFKHIKVCTDNKISKKQPWGTKLIVTHIIQDLGKLKRTFTRIYMIIMITIKMHSIIFLP